MLDVINQKPRGRPRGDQRQRELVLAAFALLAERGFEGLRVRDVADRVGVNVATLHYYFREKNDLIRGVLDYATERFRTVCVPLTEASPCPELLQEFMDLDTHLHQEPELFRVLNELQLHAGRHPEIRVLLAAMEEGWRAHLMALITAAQGRGVLRPELSPEQVALELIALLRGVALQRSCGLPAPSLPDTGRRYLRGLCLPERNNS